jgi:hypothetical protein
MGVVTFLRRPSATSFVSRRSRSPSETSFIGSSLAQRKRRLDQIEVSPTPSAKKRKRHPFDGAVLPWPMSITDFEDLGQLRVIREDLARFSNIINGKISKLEEALRSIEADDDDDELDPKDKAYWEDQLADLADF